MNKSNKPGSGLTDIPKEHENIAKGISGGGKDPFQAAMNANQSIIDHAKESFQKGFEGAKDKESELGI